MEGSQPAEPEMQIYGPPAPPVPAVRLCALAALIGTGVIMLPSFVSAELAGFRTTAVIGMAREPDVLGRFSVMSAACVVENALFAVAPCTDRWVRQPVLVEQLPTLQNGL